MAGIPSYAIPLSVDRLPLHYATCWDVGGLVQSTIDQDAPYWESSFENDWHLNVLGLILAGESALFWRHMYYFVCASYDEDSQHDLDFMWAGDSNSYVRYLFSEIIVLEPNELREITVHFDALKARLLTEPNLLGDIDFNNPLQPKVVKALLLKSRSERVVSEDNFVTMTEGFIAYLESQRQAVQYAADAGLHLLHVRFHG